MEMDGNKDITKHKILFMGASESILNKFDLIDDSNIKRPQSFKDCVFNLSKRINMQKNGIYKSSIYEDYIYTMIMKDRNEITEEEFEIYESLFKFVISNIEYPDLIVYFNTSIYHDEMILRLSDYTNVILAEKDIDHDVLIRNIEAILNSDETNIAKGMIEAKRIFKGIEQGFDAYKLLKEMSNESN